MKNKHIALAFHLAVVPVVSFGLSYSAFAFDSLDPFESGTGFRLSSDPGTARFELSLDDSATHSAWWLDQQVTSVRNELGETDERLQRFGVDFNYRVLGSDTSDSYLAAAFGWQQIGLDDGSGSSVSLGLSGRYDLFANTWLYGEGAWLPQMEGVDTRVGSFGYLVDTGIGYQPLPSLQLRAGFRQSGLDVRPDQGGHDPSQQLFIGAGFRW